MIQQIDPSQDGITHINACGQGKTELGRLLSNFAHTPFHLVVEGDSFGRWESVEGLWYALSLHPETWDDLRPLHGYEAKKLGRARRDRRDPSFFLREYHPLFRAVICAAVRCKIEQNPTLKRLLVDSGDLPILHYFVRDGKVDQPDRGLWEWDRYDTLRTIYQKGQTP